MCDVREVIERMKQDKEYWISNTLYDIAFNSPYDHKDTLAALRRVYESDFKSSVALLDGNVKALIDRNILFWNAKYVTAQDRLTQAVLEQHFIF